MSSFMHSTLISHVFDVAFFVVPSSPVGQGGSRGRGCLRLQAGQAICQVCSRRLLLKVGDSLRADVPKGLAQRLRRIMHVDSLQFIHAVYPVQRCFLRGQGNFTTTECCVVQPARRWILDVPSTFCDSCCTTSSSAFIGFLMNRSGWTSPLTMFSRCSCSPPERA